MMRVLWNGRSAMMANQDKLDAISNNLSNVSTEGYKRVDVKFKDLAYETLKRQGYPTTDNNANLQFTGTGVRSTGWIRDQKQGALKDTGKTTDLAIDGEGYFKLTRADGSTVYSREGNFKIDPMNGRLVDAVGNILSINYNPGINGENMRFTQENLFVDSDGNVSIQNGNNKTDVGRIPVFSPIGDDALISVGDSYYVPKDGVQVNESRDFNIRQGFIELSNVDIASEFTDMILTQRAFELGSKGIKAADEMWGMINNLKSR